MLTSSAAVKAFATQLRALNRTLLTSALLSSSPLARLATPEPHLLSKAEARQQLSAASTASFRRQLQSNASGVNSCEWTCDDMCVKASVKSSPPPPASPQAPFAA